MRDDDINYYWGTQVQGQAINLASQSKKYWRAIEAKREAEATRYLDAYNEAAGLFVEYELGYPP